MKEEYTLSEAFPAVDGDSDIGRGLITRIIINRERRSMKLYVKFGAFTASKEQGFS